MKKSDVIKGALILTTPFVVAEVAKADDANNWGWLNIAVKLEGKQMSYSLDILKHDFYYPGASDGLDQYDSVGTFFDPGLSGAFADIEGNKIVSEYSPNASRTAKHVKGYYNGTITPGQEPNIIVELSWQYAEPDVGRFGDMPLILTKETPDGNNVEINGYRGDIRAEMDYSGPDFASIPFGKLPAGTYTPDTPFLHLRVDFEKLIADLDGHDTVNLKDYAIMAKYWLHEGPCVADISGPDGVPDLIVDVYDIAKLAEQWLQTQPISKATYDNLHRKIDPILMNYKVNTDFYQQQREKFFAQYGPKEGLENIVNGN